MTLGYIISRRYWVIIITRPTTVVAISTVARLTLTNVAPIRVVTVSVWGACVLSSVIALIYIYRYKTHAAMIDLLDDLMSHLTSSGTCVTAFIILMWQATKSLFTT